MIANLRVVLVLSAFAAPLAAQSAPQQLLARMARPVLPAAARRIPDFDGAELKLATDSVAYTVLYTRRRDREQLVLYAGSGDAFRTFTDYDGDGMVDAASLRVCESTCARVSYERPSAEWPSGRDSEALPAAQRAFEAESELVLRLLNAR